MDRTDKKILQLLQLNCQISNLELADKVSLSPSPCLRRVKLLEQQGYIKRQVALLDPEKIGLQLSILVSVGLDSHSAELMSGFEQSVKDFPEVVKCYLITGQSADYLLKVMVPDLKHFQQFLMDKLTCIEGVSSIHSSFVLQSIVDKTALPLTYL